MEETLPGQVEDTPPPPAPPAAQRVEYVTPFAVNATVSCFRLDGRVQAGQLVRDGEGVSVERLKLDLRTPHFLLCYDEASAVPATVPQELEAFHSRLTHFFQDQGGLPTPFDTGLPIPVIFTSTGRRRPFTPAWLTGLPLRMEGLRSEKSAAGAGVGSRSQGESVMCLLVRSLEEAQLGLAALALGKGLTSSLACTLSSLALGLTVYLLANEGGTNLSLPLDEGSAGSLEANEQMLVALEKIPSFQKVMTGCLQPALYRAYSHSLVHFFIKTHGLDGLSRVGCGAVRNKAVELEEGLFATLAACMQAELHQDLDALQQAWHVDFYDRHKTTLVQTGEFVDLPAALKVADCFASTAIMASTLQAGSGAFGILAGGGEDGPDSQALALKTTPGGKEDGSKDIVLKVEGGSAEDAVTGERDPSAHVYMPHVSYTVAQVLRWTHTWVQQNERQNYTRCLLCILYLFLFSGLYPFMLMNMFDKAAPNQDWLDFAALALAVSVGLVLRTQAEYLLKASTPSGARFVPVLQLRVAKHMVQFPQSHLDQCTGADLRRYVSLLEHDIPCINKNIDALMEGLSCSAQVLGAVIVLLYVSPILTAVYLLVLPLFYFYSERLAASLSNTGLMVREYEFKFLEAVRENLERSALKKVLGLGRFLDGKLEGAGTTIAAGYQELSQVSAMNHRGLQLLRVLALGLILVLGGLLLALEVVTFGALLAFYLGSAALSTHVVTITGCHNHLNTSRGPLAHLLSLLSQPTDPSELSKVGLPGEAGLLITKVTHHGVEDHSGELRCFLKDVSLSIPAGAKVALVGDVRDSASLLVRFCTGLYRPQSGHIRVNDVPLARISAPKTIAVVDVDLLFFEGSIKENIAIGLEGATHDQVEEASKQACLHSEVMEMEHGYSAPVGYGGERLSLTLRQRLALARALIRQLPVLLLDQPLTAQDPETLAQIGKTLADLHFTAPLSGNRFPTTVMMATNTLALFKSFDVVVHMTDGKVVETGSPVELIAKKGAFWSLFAEKDGLGLDPVSGQTLISAARLRTLWPFANVQEDEALQVMIKNMSTKFCLGQEVLHTKGTSQETMFILLKGSVSEVVSRGGREVLVRQWQAGEVLGLENLVRTAQPWTTTAVSSPGSVVAMLKRHYFSKTVDSHPGLRFTVRPTLRKLAFLRSPLYLSLRWPLLGLGDEALERIASQCCHVEVYEPGTKLFHRPANSCTQMYIVVTGRINVMFETFDSSFNRQYVQRYLGPGSCIGEATLAGLACPQLWKARVMEKTILMTCSASSLQLAHNPAASKEIREVVEDNAARRRRFLSADHLRKTWLFSVLPQSLLAVLPGLFQVRCVAMGGLVLDPGGRGGLADEHCHVLLRGSLLITHRLSSGELSTSTIGEGAVFNELALAGDPVVLGGEVVCCEAQEHSMVASCSREALHALLEPVGMYTLVRELAERRAAVKADAFLKTLGLSVPSNLQGEGSSRNMHTLLGHHSQTSTFPQDYAVLPGDDVAKSLLYIILQGHVRVSGPKGVRDLGPGENFRFANAQHTGTVSVRESLVDQASISSAQCILFMVKSQAKDLPAEVFEDTALEFQEQAKRASKREALGKARRDVQVAEERLGLRPKESVWVRWRRALYLVRSALQLGVVPRLNDHLCLPIAPDPCRSVDEEVHYLTAYLTQLQTEVGRRETELRRAWEPMRKLGRDPEDTVILDSNPFDLTFPRLARVPLEAQALREERERRVAQRRKEVGVLWTRVSTPEVYVKRVDLKLKEVAYLPEVFQLLRDEEAAVREVIQKSIHQARDKLKNLWPVLKVVQEKRQPFLPAEEPFPTIELLDAYEEEVRKLVYATEVFKPIEFDPVKFHLALLCKNLREQLSLAPGDDDPLERTTEDWNNEVVSLQKAMWERNCERGRLQQRCCDLWELLGVDKAAQKTVLSQYEDLRTDTLSQLEAKADELAEQYQRKKYHRWHILRQLRTLWTNNQVKVEDQDRIIQHYDDVLPRSFAALQKEMDLQKAINAATQKLEESSNSNDEDTMEVERVSEVLRKLKEEEAELRLLETVEFEEKKANYVFEEEETQEMKVMKQMEELAKMREEKAARLLQARMRGFQARYQMKVMLQLMQDVKAMWAALFVPEAEQEKVLAPMNGLKIQRRTFDLRLLKMDLEHKVAKMMEDRRNEELRADELDRQRRAFGMFARVVGFWEKLEVPKADREPVTTLLGLPCAEFMEPMHKEEKLLQERYEAKLRLYEERRAAEQAASSMDTQKKKNEAAERKKASLEAKKARRAARKAQKKAEESSKSNPSSPKG